MGVGVLMTPLLMLGRGMPAAAAVGTDLAYPTLTTLAAAWLHRRQGTVDLVLVCDLAEAGLITREPRGRTRLYSADAFDPVVKQFKIWEATLQLAGSLRGLQLIVRRVV